ncbi:MAG: hypothetical protein M3261_05130, partial [Thermoproteota archaeon]|nr:hypothetical protein [Thermoproteota archaeon]
ILNYQRGVTYSKSQIQIDESAKHLKKDTDSEYQMIQISLLVMFKQLQGIAIFWAIGRQRDQSHL